MTIDLHQTLVGTSSEVTREFPAQTDPHEGLRASEHRFRSIFEFLPVAVWEEDISGLLELLDGLRAGGVDDLQAWLGENPGAADGAMSRVRVLAANRAARELHGVPHDAPETTETMSLALHALAGDPQFRKAMCRTMVALWEGRTDIKAEFSIPTRNGPRKEIQARLVLPEPGSGRLLVTEINITEQRRAEERFRHVAQASSDYIFDRDFATETTWVNDAASWIPGHPPGPCHVPRTAWVDSVHPDESTQIIGEIKAAIAGGEDFWEGEYRLRQHDGSYIPVLERASILRNEAGEPVRMIGNIIDLSEQKALEAQLRQSQRLDAVGQLTGGIAHDFNNLLTVILGNAEGLVDILRADQESATMAQQIMLASERAAELTQRLLAFARKQPLSPGAFDANTIVEGMRMLIERSITPAISLNLDLFTDLGAVHVDRSMFESALLNLCVNARDAMPEGGTLRIATSEITLPGSSHANAPRAGDYVRISVSDTGAGMDGDTLARAFEPFFTTKAVGAGSGLGLSMVHGFVHQSGGHVALRSTPGNGTAVELLLPRHAGCGSAADAPEDIPSIQPATSRARVLLVEDDDLVRNHTHRIVRALGYEVEIETRAAGALHRLLEGEPFDLLLSDVVMPGGVSGRQLAEKARALRPGLPVLLLSGHAEEIAAESDGRSDPGIEFLRKPFHKSDLARRLAEMLPG